MSTWAKDAPTFTYFNETVIYGSVLAGPENFPSTMCPRTYCPHCIGAETMHQLAFTDIPRVRKSNPITSHIAAEKCKRFADSHKGRILAALNGGKLAVDEIAQRAGLTIVQVDRRLHEMPEVRRIGDNGTYGIYEAV